MFREINLTEGKTAYLNRDAIEIIEKRGEYAFIRLVDGSEYMTKEIYEEFLEEFGLIIKTGTKPGQK